MFGEDSESEVRLEFSLGGSAGSGGRQGEGEFFTC